MKKSMWTAVVVMSALMFAACGKKEEKTAEESGAEEAKAEKSAVAVEKVQEEAEEAVEQAAENEKGEKEGPKNLQELGAALGKAMQEAAKAEGDTPCERGYNGLVKMMEVMGGKDEEMPTKEKYMEVCQTLPEDMQKCMDMSYAMKNGEECKKVQEETDPAIIEKAKALMAK